MAQGFAAHDWLSAIYVAYWGRAADPGGLDYWVNMWGGEDDQGRTQDAAWFASNFALQPEAADAYPYFEAHQQGQDITPDMRGDFIDAIYTNLFNRAPDEDGQAYWLGQLEIGNVDPGEFIATIVHSALEAGGEDAQTVSAKKDVAAHITTQLKDSGLEKEQTLEFLRSEECKALIGDTGPDNMDRILDDFEDILPAPDRGFLIIEELPGMDTSGYETSYSNIIDNLLSLPGAQAGLLKPDEPQQAYLHIEAGERWEFDHDTFVLDLEAGNEYRIVITPEDPSNFQSNKISWLYGPTGARENLIMNYTNGFFDGSLYSDIFTAQEDGEHFVSVSLRWSSDFGEYADGPEPYVIELVGVNTSAGEDIGAAV